MRAELESIERAVVTCTRCPELRAYSAQIAREKKRAHAGCTYWGKPVPAFGNQRARLIIVGLAPGAHGSNRTGRPFTGDASGNFLYPALYRAGFASQPNAVDRDDGLELVDCLVTAAVRCAPPHNKPTPAQLLRCAPYLLEEIRTLPSLEVVVGLGAIGTRAAVRALTGAGFMFAERLSFAHGAETTAVHREDSMREVTLVASYHPSRQNTNTGVLTEAMFDAIFRRVCELLLERSGHGAAAGRGRPR